MCLTGPTKIADFCGNPNCPRSAGIKPKSIGMSNNCKYMTGFPPFDFHISLKTKKRNRLSRSVSLLAQQNPSAQLEAPPHRPPHGSILISTRINVPYKVSYVNCIIFTLPPNSGKRFIVNRINHHNPPSPGGREVEKGEIHQVSPSRPFPLLASPLKGEAR